MMKGQKGITLVALIITIIVMLILVAVTISVALNGGLFAKAREATLKTKVEQVKEALALAKAEYLADYFEGSAAGSQKAPSDSEFIAKVNEYLDKVTVTSVSTDKRTTYTVTGTSDAEVTAYFTANTTQAKEATVEFTLAWATAD